MVKLSGEPGSIVTEGTGAGSGRASGISVPRLLRCRLQSGSSGGRGLDGLL